MRRISRTRPGRGLAALLTAGALAVGLAGCGGNGNPATRPDTARKQPRTGGPAAFPAGPYGPVDCRRTKCVALTFDTGPSVRTPRILDILARYRVHATFFTLGKNHVTKYPDTVRRMVAEGHEVETLTWSHQILTEISASEVREEITRGRDAVQKVTGVRPSLLRPPQGRTNDTVTAICKQLGMAEVLWSASAADYMTTDSALITKRILARTGPDGIILLHDFVDPTNAGYNGTVAAVPGIVSTLQARGYTFVTVAQLLAPGKPQPGNVYR